MCPTVRTVAWADLFAHLPPRPDPALDSVLDAAGECFERQGPTRTTMTDIAKRAGIARSTLYQRVNSVDQVGVLFLVRELHRFADDHLPPGPIHGAADLGAFLATFVRWITVQPGFDRLREEADLVADLVAHQSAALDLVASMLTPGLSALMAAGLVRRHDPAMLAGWLTRLIVLLTLAPPPGDVGVVVAALVVPALEPE